MRGRVLGLLAFAALGGCVSIDTGYIDYRRADDVDALKTSAANQSRCNWMNFPPKEGEDQRRQINVYEPGDPKVCYPLLGAKLYRKNLAGSGIIKKDDIYSIRLDHGFMQYVSEFPFRPGRILDGKSPFRAQAEIVVLARAFEFGVKEEAVLAPAAGDDIATPATTPAPPAAPGEANAAGAPDFVDLDSLNAARVIYYSPDVENGQSLNFSNIPIMGPVKYQGQPVGIQIIVLELDRISPEMQGLLSSLASLGQTAGALPSGAAAGILINLGKSLLESNQDDVIFEYRFVLDPNDKPHSYNSAPFETGRYVLRRLQSRDGALVWRNLLLDHNTGQLFLVTNNAANDVTAAAEPYVRETYFTVNIIKHGAGVKETSYVQRSWKDLSDAIDAAAQERDEKLLAKTITDIKDRQKVLAGAQATQGLAAQWDEIVADANRLAFGFPPDNLPLGGACTIDQSKLAGKKVAEYELARGAHDFARDWNTALAGNDTVTFGADQQARIIDTVAAFFLNPAVQSQAGLPSTDDFSTDAKFQAFIDGSLATALGAYVENVRPKTCSELSAAGLGSD